MKRCGKCGVEKTLDSFHRDKSRKDGRHPYCAVCQTAKASLWCKENRDRARVNVKRYKSRHRKEIADRNRAYDAANREKRAAHSAAHVAVKDGRIKRRKKCQRCWRPAAHMHHADYTKPLDIEWLCHFCHRKVHA